MKISRVVHLLGIAWCLLLLGACAAGGDVRKPIPVAFQAAPQPARRLVVMLPGRGDDLESLQRRDMARLIQKRLARCGRDTDWTDHAFLCARQGKRPPSR